MSKRKPRKKLRELSRHDWIVLSKIVAVMVITGPFWLIECALRFGAYLHDKWDNCQFLINLMDRLRTWSLK